MQYNIVTMANKPYFRFLSILINSALDKCNFDFINKFYIVDTGLDQDQLKWIRSRHNKIEILTTSLNTSYEGGPWGQSWLLNVKNKTSFLYYLLQQIQEPILLVDSDTMFVTDPIILTKFGGDIQVCIRPNHTTKYIGSYLFILNANKANEFIHDWMREVQVTTSMPPESPSLCKIVDEYKDKINIVEIDQSIVNIHHTSQLTDKTVIVHFKGSDLVNDLDHQYNKRLNSRGWTNYIQKYIEHV